MADAFTYKAVGQKFGSGEEYSNLTVVNFAMPDGTKACAYCCGMNIDLDGEPQAYGPFSKPDPRPLDYLENAGWLSQNQNNDKKIKYEAAKKNLTELESQKTKLLPSAADAQKKELDAKIEAAKKTLKALNPYDRTAKNYEKIFWHWYGLKALTPAEALKLTHHETIGDKVVEVRHPVLDTTAMYEDVNGRFPVVQSKYEPGPGYFVSVLPQRVNPAFPIWDQRAFLPAVPSGNQVYAALSKPLENATGVKLKDIVLAIRLDTYAWSHFPFLDVGLKPKVGECSVGAFKSLDGENGAPKNGRPTYKNNFQVVYLAFPSSAGQTPATVLSKFAKASNASDLPMILAFIAKATTDAKTKSKGGTAAVTTDPLKEWEQWNKGNSEFTPHYFDMIAQSLSDAGFR